MVLINVERSFAQDDLDALRLNTMTINIQFMNYYKYEIYLEHFIEFLGKSFLANQEKIVSKNWKLNKHYKRLNI